MRMVTWFIASLCGLAGAVAVEWCFEAGLVYWLGAALAPSATLMYATAQGAPTAKTLSSAAISLVLALILIGAALIVLLYALADFA